MNKNKKMLALLLEFILRNVIIYLILSLIYLNFNPMNWWIIQNPWGRFIIIIFELGLLGRIDKEVSKEFDKEYDDTDK